MRHLVILFLSVGWVVWVAPHSQAEITGQPFAVVELFTSEGCSSCPVADQILSAVTKTARQEGARIYTLSMHVDYWNDLGWKDPLSAPQFTQRQREYAKALRNPSVYTPQVIVNGEVGFGGYKKKQLLRTIAEKLQKKSSVQLGFKLDSNDKSTVHFSFRLNRVPKNSILQIALVERGITSKVLRGENAGRTLTHENVVWHFASYPLKANKGSAAVAIPDHVDRSQASVIAFVQDAKTLKILGAQAVDL